MGIGERLEQDVAHEAVDDGDRANPQREREDGDDREAGCSGQGARRIPDIPARIFEPDERPRVALDFFRLLDAAERATGGRAPVRASSRA
jgi:hypothetical protein